MVPLLRMLIVAAYLGIASGVCFAIELADRPVRRLLVVYQDASTLPASIEIAEGLSRRLATSSEAQFEIYTEYLDSVRFPDPDNLRRHANNMAGKFRTVPLDIVVTVGPGALRFMLDYHSQIAPGSQVVFGDVSARTLQSLTLPSHVKGVVSPFDVTKSVELAIRLQPEATSIVVLSGSGVLDRYWQDSAREKLKDRFRDLPVRYLSDQAFDGFITEAKKLPARTILLILTVFEDAAGQKYVPRQAAMQIAAASSAPAYGLLSSYVGTGILGGDMGTFKSTGEVMAAIAIQVASGDTSVPQTVIARSAPVVDWRQLVRWNIDPDRLPQNVNLLYYDPTLWERYRWHMIILGIVLLAQSMAIAGLFVERRGRRTAELLSRRRLLEVIHLNQAATAGALSASIAHELNQPLGAIRSNAEAAEAMLRGEMPDLKLIQQILSDIRNDDQRASEIILRLRKLLQKRREIDWQEFDLNEAVKSAVSMISSEAQRRKVNVVACQANGELRVRADQVHIQQVILNLAANAMDAMQDSTHRVLTVQTMLPEVSKVQVTISDTGDGVPDSERANIFEPFYTTKPRGTGLGLAIARTIIETYDGKLWLDSGRDGGASFHFVLPLAQRG